MGKRIIPRSQRCSRAVSWRMGAAMFDIGWVSLAVLSWLCCFTRSRSAVFTDVSLNQTGRFVQPIVQSNSLFDVMGQETCEFNCGKYSERPIKSNTTMKLYILSVKSWTTHVRRWGSGSVRVCVCVGGVGGEHRRYTWMNWAKANLRVLSRLFVCWCCYYTTPLLTRKRNGGEGEHNYQVALGTQSKCLGALFVLQAIVSIIVHTHTKVLRICCLNGARFPFARSSKIK